MAKKPMTHAEEERRESAADHRREGKNDNENAVGLSDIHKMYAKKPHNGGKGKRRG